MPELDAANTQNAGHGDDIEVGGEKHGNAIEDVTKIAGKSARDANVSHGGGKPWSVYSPAQKKMLILTVSAASLFSPLSSQIYFPALNAIAYDLNVSDTLVNLTITIYQVCFAFSVMVSQ